MNPTQQALSGDVSHYLNLARANYFTVWTLYFLSIGASVTATVFAATESPGKVPMSILTVIPGVVLLLLNTFKFSARSQWHYEKKRRLDSLFRLSVAEADGTTAPEVAAKWNQIDKEMDETYPGWGDPPKPSPKS
jgi:hypothetical protein